MTDHVMGESGGDDPLDGDKLEDGMGLCLSGGGFKAAAFHLGGLMRLNELGLLKKLKRVSSVSGGSITAGWTGLKWNSLTWQGDVASNFTSVVAKPLITFCMKAKIDVSSIISGVLNPFEMGAERLRECYEDLLFGKATLQDLPDDAQGPRFVFNATNLQLNSLWRISKPYMADYRVGFIDKPKLPLATAVAASSAFPPFLSPLKLDLSKYTIQPLAGADRHFPPFTRDAYLADGGIYDNLGLETVWKRYRTILVSNAGDPFPEDATPPTEWLTQLRRVVRMMHRQGENHRARWLIALADAKERQVALWGIRGKAGSYKTPGAIALPDADALLAAEEDVRLAPLKREEVLRLVQHGYSMADAATRKFIAPNAAPPTALPPLP